MIAWLFIGTLISFVRSTPVLSLFTPIASEIEAVSGRKSGLENCPASLLVLSIIVGIAVWLIARFTMGEASSTRFTSLIIAF